MISHRQNNNQNNQQNNNTSEDHMNKNINAHIMTTHIHSDQNKNISMPIESNKHQNLTTNCQMNLTQTESFPDSQQSNVPITTTHIQIANIDTHPDTPHTIFQSDKPHNTTNHHQISHFHNLQNIERHGYPYIYKQGEVSHPSFSLSSSSSSSASSCSTFERVGNQGIQVDMQDETTRSRLQSLQRLFQENQITESEYLYRKSQLTLAFV